MAVGPRRTGDVRGELAGVGPLIRFVLRRDRILLAVWVLLMAVFAVALASGGDSAYPTQADRVTAVEQTAANPALLLLRGPVFAPTPGALAAQGFVSSGVLITGLASLLLLIRHTRVDEQAGRRELLGSTVVGRGAPLAAALAVVVAGNVGVAILVALGLLGTGLPVAGSVAFGLALGGAGIVFAGVGAIAAQITEGAGGARTIGVIVLAVTLLVAGIGHLTSSWLVWLSPFGWARLTRAYAGEQWWVLPVFLLCAAVLVAAAFALSARRDIAAGLVPTRRGPSVAGPSLRSALALAWRVHRSSALGWAFGLAAAGIALGAAMASIGDLFDTPAYRELAATLGDGDASEAFLGLVLYVLAQVVAASVVIAALRIRSQETGGLGDLLLSGPVARARWASGHLVVAACCAVLALAALGLGAGLGYGDIGILATTLAYLPACLVFVGLAMALVGWLPTIAVPATWTLLALAVAVDFLGEFRILDPSTLAWITPFAATSVPLSSGSGLGTALVVLVVIAVALAGVGLLGLRRRDMDAA